MKEKFIMVGKARIPVDQEVYEEYFRLIERMKYIHKLEKDRVISYDQAEIDELPIEGMMFDRQELLEDIVMHRITIQELHSCLKQLQQEEQELINELFFCGRSEHELSRRTGIPQKTINDRKNKMLRRLRKLLNS